MPQTKKYRPESDCGNYLDYQDAENPHYESVNPHEVKHNPKHLRQYIYSWIWFIVIVAGISATIYFWVNS